MYHTHYQEIKRVTRKMTNSINGINDYKYNNSINKDNKIQKRHVCNG